MSAQNNENHNNIEEVTTDELLEQIEEDKKQVKKSSVMAFAALIAIIALCIAWFVMNNNVRGIPGSVSAQSDIPFLLASVGERQSVEADLLKENGKNLLTEGKEEQYKEYIDLATGKKESTEAKTYHIGTSDLALYLNSQESFRPGANGKQEFYMIPQKAGLSNVTVTFDLTGYTENDSKAVKIDDARLQNLIKGHILFFENLNDKYGYSGWLGENNALKIQAPTNLNGGQFEKGIPYKVTLWWVWPRYFRNYVYTQRSTQGDLFTENIDKGKDSEYSEIINYLNVQKEKVDSEQNTLFYNKENTSSSLSGQLINSTMSDDVLNECSSYYNHADEYIGTNARYIFVKVNVK